MKKLLFVFALGVLLLPFAPLAKSQEVSIDFFYNNLNGGSWMEVGNYGYCWQPDVAVSDPSWRPYSDGYWAYTDLGWTWVSYEDYGWATYHYGRWVRLADYGWVWRPGYEWGPAWVSWRFGGGYCGWAPLPPETEVVYESRPLTGHLDVEFDIGPAYYNFVDVRYIGEPVLRSRNVDVNAAAKSGGLMKVQGNSLMVGAPTTIKKSATQIAPPTVKTKVTDVKVEKGWSVAGDANAQAQLKEKIKTQDLKKVPPTTIGGNAAAAVGASVSPAASLAPGMAPVEKGKKGKGAQQFQAGATTSPAGALTSPTTSPAFPERGKKKGNLGEQAQSGASLAPTESPGAAVSPYTPEYGKPGKGKRGEKFGGTPPPTGPTAGPEGVIAPEGKQKGFERQNVGPTPGGAASPGENFNQPRGKRKQFEQQQPGTSPASATSPGESFNQPDDRRNKRVEQPGTSPSGQEGGPPGAQGGPYGEGRGKHKAEGMNVPPAGGGQMPAGTGQPAEKKHEGKGAGATPTPGPQ